MSAIIDALKAILLKGNFLASLAMFGFIVLMVVEKDINTRALLLVPVVLFYATSKVLYAMEQAEATREIIKKYKEKYEGKSAEKQ